MAHVLIGFGEALPAAEVIFSLRAAGHEVSAFARSERIPIRALPLRCLVVMPAPESDAAAAAGALARLLDELRPDVLLPLDDTGLWLSARLPAAAAISAGATGAAAAFALDKRLQVEAARQAGLAVPETAIANRPADLWWDGAFPAILKPAMAVQERLGGTFKGGVSYLGDAGEVRALKDRDQEGGPYILQALTRGVGQGVFGYAGPDGVTAWSGHRRLRMMNPHGSGASATVSVEPDAGLRGKIAEFMRICEWRGPFMMEFLTDAVGTSWFMELNGRMWGSLALARRQGFEYPAWAVAGKLDGNFRPQPPGPARPGLVVRHLGRELLHLAFVLRGPRHEFFRQSWPGILSSLAGVLRPGRPGNFYNFDSGHPLFFLRDAAWTIRKALT